MGQVAVRGIPDREDWWVCIVSVGNVILFESSAGPMDFVLDEALRKMSSLSQRVKIALHPNDQTVVPDTSGSPDADDSDD
jgi:hypothetical protein